MLNYLMDIPDDKFIIFFYIYFYFIREDILFILCMIMIFSMSLIIENKALLSKL